MQTKGSVTRTSTERKESRDEGDVVHGALIYGYLQKLGRNNKWQTRWFETDGECLTYYKSSKRTKLLATLDLAKVGSIVINHEDPKGCCFTINIAERPYHLRADSRAACKDWVIMLNRVKEARMQEGNVKIVNEPPDLLDDNFTPRVVVVANRQRTHAVEDEDLASWEAGGYGNTQVDPATGVSADPAYAGKYTVGAPASNRLARWQKPRNSLSKWASKVLSWARSLRKYGCADSENHVVLDHHLHPPGHDDAVKSGAPKTISTNPSATDSWSKTHQNPADRGMMQPRSHPPINVTINNEYFDTDSMNPSTTAGSPTVDRPGDDEDETRELS
jgi:PH domain